MAILLDIETLNLDIKWTVTVDLTYQEYLNTTQIQEDTR